MLRGRRGLPTVALLLALAWALAGCQNRPATQQADDRNQGARETAGPSAEQIAHNWPQFRGPDGSGVSLRENPPTQWDARTGEGILWKTRIPLPGTSSPILWEGRVFVTGAAGTTRVVYCIDAMSGDMQWERKVSGVAGSPSPPPEVPESTTYAAPTPATDGQHVFALFGNSDLACFDMEGTQVWAKNVGSLDNMYGHASSLVVHGGLLFVLLDQGLEQDGLSRLVALRTADGETAWETKRPVAASWATPLVIQAEGREELITCAQPWVIAYAPDSGTELWRAACIRDDVAPSPVYAGGLLFTVNIRSCLAAIRPGGSGDVTGTHVVWQTEENLPSICSPLSDGERIFLLTAEGLFTCFSVDDGRKLWEHDFEALFAASPSLAEGGIYITNEEGTTILVAAESQFRELGRAELAEPVRASFAFDDDRIYIRGSQHLYCIGSGGARNTDGATG